VTNLGLGFVLMTLVVAIGATNTGNNGLYVLVSLFLGALVVSGVVSRRNVERLVVELEGPDEVFAGVPARFVLKIRNVGWLPRRGILVKVSGSAAPLLFARIARGEQAVRAVDLVFPRRGRRGPEQLLVYSGYPIGLFRKGRLHRAGDERTVFPAPAERITTPPQQRPLEQGHPRSQRSGRGHEVRYLREGADGDDPRDIHWSQTARQGRVIVRQRAADEARDVLIVLDGAGAPGPEAFEGAVSEATGLALQLLARGDRVGLSTAGALLRPGTGPAQRRGLLSVLALAEPGPAGSTVAAPLHVLVYVVKPREGRAA
jgi:uncharacterized protein (DUF58 family)